MRKAPSTIDILIAPDGAVSLEAVDAEEAVAMAAAYVGHVDRQQHLTTISEQGVAARRKGYGDRADDLAARAKPYVEKGWSVRRTAQQLLREVPEPGTTVDNYAKRIRRALQNPAPRS